MAGNFTFHNKFHRSNHHTISGLRTIDSGLDPIATQAEPFLGIFFNIVTDQQRSFNYATNSYDWWSAFTTMRANSGTWMLTRSLYTTVSSLSDNWNLGLFAYTSIRSLSALYRSLYQTVSSLSASWGSPYLMYTNRSQVYTHSKAFSGQDLFPIGYSQYIGGTVVPAISVYNWNLDTQQVAFLDLNVFPFGNVPSLRPEVLLNNTVNGVRGGLYTLQIKQRNTGTPVDVVFSTTYRFNDRSTRTGIVTSAPGSTTVINFLKADSLMLGDVYYLTN